MEAWDCSPSASSGREADLIHESRECRSQNKGAVTGTHGFGREPRQDDPWQSTVREADMRGGEDGKCEPPVASNVLIALWFGMRQRHLSKYPCHVAEIASPSGCFDLVGEYLLGDVAEPGRLNQSLARGRPGQRVEPAYCELLSHDVTSVLGGVHAVHPR